MEKFYVGLDIGTESVGIACTDEEYNLLRARGKDLWAVRLFEPATDASSRRITRTSRRRMARREQRIDFLQEVFAPFMEDKLFFLRMNNSGFYEEDKAEELASKYSLFADPDFTDREFYQKYPTAFHLRSDLIKSSEKQDLRLYYIAIHHIVKYRGHFLSEGSLAEIRDIKRLFNAYNELTEELYGEDGYKLPVDKAEDFKIIALDKKKKSNDKNRSIRELFGVNSKAGEAAVKAILGEAFKTAVLFDNPSYEEEKSLSFQKITDEDFESKAEIYGDDFGLLKALRDIYSFTVFEKILNGNARISDAMIEIYEKHKSDLARLKNFVKNYGKKGLYFEIFRSTKEKSAGGNYVNYIGYTKTKKEKINVEKCNYEDFLKFLTKKLTPLQSADLPDVAKAELNSMLSEIKDAVFLPKIINADNGVFPRQINEAELSELIKNLVRDYPEFAEKGEDGKSAAEKIRAIFSFKIPYYVGPLNTYHEAHGGNSWAVRKENSEGRITPWNFEEKIDTFASNEKFIRRMTNKCSYLYGKDVLPKFSIIYQKYDVLNQINKLKINGIPIDVELKKKLYRDLFLVYPKVTDKKIKSYLVQIGQLTAEEARTVEISGKDKQDDLRANMGSYITLKKILGDYLDAHLSMAEEIILWHTLNTDKNIVEEMILRKYGGEGIVKEKIKQLKGLTSFKDFGRLSKEFLCELQGGADPVTGEIYTVIERLYDTNENLNEILHNERYSFLDAIEEENGYISSEVTYADIAEMPMSPLVKRGVWQAVKMVDEYVAAVGRAPDKIFIEVTRENQAEQGKGRTVSRKTNLLNLYKNLTGVEHLLEQLNSEETTDMRLRQERLYLYFLQLGRCAYTGQIINLDQLNTDIYDVDHIVPQSMIKDDSLENKVLVVREKNKEKSDTYPLKSGFTDQQKFWKLLHDKKLMGDKKYAALTRIAPLTNEDYQGFIARQIVVTSQTVKAVAELMKRKYDKDGTTVVYSKAANVNEFKQKREIYKCRETNDLHHARDAYLNIVVGNIYDTVFTSRFAYFYQKDNGDGWRKYNLDRLFDRDHEGAWDHVRDMETVRKVLAKPSMAVTRYSLTGKGEFYNQTVYGKDDEGVSVPRKWEAPYNLKTADGKGYKYGGYKSLNTAYFSIVSSLDKKGNRIKTIEAVPVYYNYLIKGDKQKLLQYFKDVAGLKSPEIIIPVVKIKTLLRVNGFPARIAGMTGKQIILHNAVQWYTDQKTDRYINGLVKIVQFEKDEKLSEEDKVKEEFLLDTNRFRKVGLSINRAENISLYDKILAQLEKPMYKGISGTGAFYKNLTEEKEKFCILSVLDQAKVLLQCAKFLKCNAETADLTLIGQGANCGKLRINKDITKIKLEIIDQSPCGLTERVRMV